MVNAGILITKTRNKEEDEAFVAIVVPAQIYESHSPWPMQLPWFGTCGCKLLGCEDHRQWMLPRNAGSKLTITHGIALIHGTALTHRIALTYGIALTHSLPIRN